MMQSILPTLIFRHRRENLKKCSLTFLEKEPLLAFYKYPEVSLKETGVDIENYMILAVDGEPLTEEDAPYGLILLDATWRLAMKMEKSLFQGIPIKKRSLPSSLRTAYPRRQEDCPIKDQGLASVEALYMAHKILGRESAHYLDHYHWKNEFLQRNGLFFQN